MNHRDSRSKSPVRITGAVLLLCSFGSGPFLHLHDHVHHHAMERDRSVVLPAAHTPQVTCGCARSGSSERSPVGCRSSRSVPFHADSTEHDGSECPSHDAHNCVICFILLQCATVVVAASVLPADRMFETLLPASYRITVATFCTAVARGPPPG